MIKRKETKTMNFIKKLIQKATSAVSRIVNKATSSFVLARTTLANARAEGYVDSGVKILIAVVIGALLLAGLYTLFSTTIMPTVTQKIIELFNYKG